MLLADATISERLANPALPDDVTITITRKGQNPTQITVRRGEQIWDVDLQNFRERLPQEIRPFVDQWVNGTGDRLALGRWLSSGQPNADLSQLSAQALSLQILDNHAKGAANAEVEAAKLQNVEKEIESLNQQLLQVQQSLEKIRKSLRSSPDNPVEPGKK